MKKNSIVSKLVLAYLLLSGLVLAHALWRDYAGQTVTASAVEPLATNLSFIARKDFLVGTDPRSAAQGDFNGDGIADLAVTNSNSQNLFIMIGNGDGTFQPPTIYGLNNGAGESVVVGDFNGDGKLDLAVGVYFLANRGEIAVFLGRGNGLFDPGTRISIPGWPQQLAAADLNGDGKLDLALSVWASPNFYTLLGNGDGSFQAPRGVNAGRTSSSLALGDFNGDKLLDVALATEPIDQPGQVRILLGNGDGSFGAPTSRNVGVTPWFIVAGDHNRDGKLDLVVATSDVGQRNKLAFLRGNGDGLLDLVGPGSYAARIWFGNARADFDAYHVVFGMEETPGAIAAGDLNGDGLVDLVAANPQGNKVTIFINDTK